MTETPDRETRYPGTEETELPLPGAEPPPAASAATAEAPPALRIMAGCIGFAHEFASHEETRYYLNGLNMEPHPEGGVIVTATDGHRLFTVHDPAAELAEPCILQFSAGFAARCRREPFNTVAIRGPLDRKRRMVATISESDMTFSRLSVSEIKRRNRRPIPAGDSRLLDVGLALTIDGVFPDWRRVVVVDVLPTGSLSESPLKARYLASFQGPANWGGSDGSLMIRQAAKDTPAFILGTSTVGACAWIGMIMPMRADRDWDIPAFARKSFNAPPPPPPPPEPPIQDPPSDPTGPGGPREHHP